MLFAKVSCASFGNMRRARGLTGPSAFAISKYGSHVHTSAISSGSSVWRAATTRIIEALSIVVPEGEGWSADRIQKRESDLPYRRMRTWHCSLCVICHTDVNGAEQPAVLRLRTRATLCFVPSPRLKHESNGFLLRPNLPLHEGLVQAHGVVIENGLNRPFPCLPLSLSLSFHTCRAAQTRGPSLPPGTVPSGTVPPGTAREREKDRAGEPS